MKDSAPSADLRKSNGDDDESEHEAFDTLSGAVGGEPDVNDEVATAVSEPKDDTQENPGADVEKGRDPTLKVAPAEQDPNIITWDGPDDPENPRNWAYRKKWRSILIVSCFTLMSPLASSMIAPALPEVAEEFGIESGVTQNMVLSVFVLAYAVGPLIFGPLSELFGRMIVLQLSNIFFLVFNIACSRARNTTQLLAFRFFAGLGGSAPLAIGGGTISDLFTSDERGRASSIYTMAPLTGPAIGPIIGGFIAQNTTWRWVFYSSSIADGVIQILGLIFLRETYGPTLLAQKAKRLRKETSNQKLHTIYQRTDQHPALVIAWGLLRPLKYLTTEPIVMVFASYMAVLYGTMYLVLTTFAQLWVVKYNQPVGIAGLHYLALGLGFALGAQIGARALDRTYKYQKDRNGGVGTPEMRMPLMMVTSVCIPIGILIYGWTAQYRVFWLVPDIAVMFFCIGIIGSMLCTQIYLVDTFTLHAASAIGAASAFRSLAGFGFPLFANAMYGKLGDGWGNSILALVILITGVPAPFLFYRYGARIRAAGARKRKSAA